MRTARRGFWGWPFMQRCAAGSLVFSTRLFGLRSRCLNPLAPLRSLACDEARQFRWRSAYRLSPELRKPFDDLGPVEDLVYLGGNPGDDRLRCGCWCHQSKKSDGLVARNHAADGRNAWQYPTGFAAVTPSASSRPERMGGNAVGMLSIAICSWPPRRSCSTTLPASG